jgi:cytochrome c oxidase assembly protein subunit 15
VSSVQAAAVSGLKADQGPRRHDRQIAIWLLACCALVFAMVVLGGVTRLTQSGLSMVEWDPIMGIVPPLNDAQWEEAFHKYQQFPEYRDINREMTLEGFKGIFLVEYAHRVLGRSIGLVFLLPFLFFLFTGRIRRELVPKLVTMFVLGGLQGLLGWYMVKSGLVHRPHVSQYRLTAHLLTAVMIYGYILWVALGLLSPRAAYAGNAAVRGLRRFGRGITAAVVLMLASGGFVAGTKAGFAFNTFPLMNGHWVPEGVLGLHPWWRNLFENLATVQFDHRLLALVLCGLVVTFWLVARRRPLERPTRIGFNALLLMLAVQVTLGISTLLLVVPVPLGAAHQGGALVLFSLALFLNHQLRAR